MEWLAEQDLDHGSETTEESGSDSDAVASTSDPDTDVQDHVSARFPIPGISEQDFRMIQNKLKAAAYSVPSFALLASACASPCACYCCHAAPALPGARLKLIEGGSSSSPAVSCSFLVGGGRELAQALQAPQPQQLWSAVSRRVPHGRAPGRQAASQRDPGLGPRGALPGHGQARPEGLALARSVFGVVSRPAGPCSWQHQHQCQCQGSQGATQTVDASASVTCSFGSQCAAHCTPACLFFVLVGFFFFLLLLIFIFIIIFIVIFPRMAAISASALQRINFYARGRRSSAGTPDAARSARA